MAYLQGVPCFKLFIGQGGQEVYMEQTNAGRQHGTLQSLNELPDCPKIATSIAKSLPHF